MARLALIASVLAALAAAAPATATYPGRNGAIAYSVHTGGPDADSPERHALETKRPGDQKARVLLECELTEGVPSGGDCSVSDFASASYSPDGRLIAFDAGDRIGIVSAGGGPVTLLSAVSANDGSPAFAPGGKLIVFTGANDHGSTDLYVRRVDGSGVVRLLLNDAGSPAWSSRGVLAYVRSGNVYVRLPNKGRRRWVTSGVSPDWSPDGRRLAIVRPRPNLTFDGPFGRIYTVHPDGRGLTRVGRETYASNPAWSPDGRWIAYDGFDLGIHVKLVGTHKQARELAPTQYSGESGYVDSFEPAWRPLPRR